MLEFLACLLFSSSSNYFIRVWFYFFVSNLMHVSASLKNSAYSSIEIWMGLTFGLSEVPDWLSATDRIRQMWLKNPYDRYPSGSLPLKSCNLKNRTDENFQPYLKRVFCRSPLKTLQAQGCFIGALRQSVVARTMHIGVIHCEDRSFEAIWPLSRPQIMQVKNITTFGCSPNGSSYMQTFCAWLSMRPHSSVAIFIRLQNWYAVLQKLVL